MDESVYIDLHVTRHVVWMMDIVRVGTAPRYHTVGAVGAPEMPLLYLQLLLRISEREEDVLQVTHITVYIVLYCTVRCHVL